MFTKIIKDLEFIGSNADQVFPNITGDGFGDGRDLSFVATMRALLPKRMADTDKIAFLYCVSAHPEKIINDHSPDIILNHSCGDLMGRDKIFLLSMDHSGNGNSLLLEKMDNQQSVEKEYKVRELKDLRQYVKNVANLDARFYISEERRSMIIVAARPTYQNYHFLQTLIPRYLPWYFKDNPPNEEELTLLKSLGNRQVANYERIMEEFAGRIDFKSHKVKLLLGGFEKKARLSQLENIEAKIIQYREKIDENRGAFQRLIQDLDEEVIKQSGLKSIINSSSDDSELVEYFLCNKNIDIDFAENRTFAFYVKCYLDHFEPEAYERISRNRESDMYKVTLGNQGKFGSVEEIKLLFDAILSDEPTLKIKMCSYYELNTRGSVRVHSRWDFPKEYVDYIPNPHIQRHSCLGDHERYIRDALIDGNVIGAIEQCISSAKSINVLENATFPNFVLDVCATSKKIIELPDGNSATPTEALNWLKEKNAQKVSAEEVEHV